jgi:hypothetical protein
MCACRRAPVPLVRFCNSVMSCRHVNTSSYNGSAPKSALVPGCRRAEARGPWVKSAQRGQAAGQRRRAMSRTRPLLLALASSYPTQSRRCCCRRDGGSCGRRPRVDRNRKLYLECNMRGPRSRSRLRRPPRHPHPRPSSQPIPHCCNRVYRPRRVRRKRRRSRGRGGGGGASDLGAASPEGRHGNLSHLPLHAEPFP